MRDIEGDGIEIDVMTQGSKPFKHDQIIYSYAAVLRIRYLERIPGNFARDLDDNEEWELDALRQFRDEAIAEWGQKAWDDGLSLIADSYWDEWAAHDAEGIYGEATQTEFWCDDLWSERQQEKFAPVTYDNTKYWGDGQS